MTAKIRARAGSGRGGKGVAALAGRDAAPGAANALAAILGASGGHEKPRRARAGLEGAGRWGGLGGQCRFDRRKCGLFVAIGLHSEDRPNPKAQQKGVVAATAAGQAGEDVQGGVGKGLFEHRAISSISRATASRVHAYTHVADISQRVFFAQAADFRTAAGQAGPEARPRAARCAPAMRQRRPGCERCRAPIGGRCLPAAVAHRQGRVGSSAAGRGIRVGAWGSSDYLCLVAGDDDGRVFAAIHAAKRFGGAGCVGRSHKRADLDHCGLPFGSAEAVGVDCGAGASEAGFVAHGVRSASGHVHAVKVAGKQRRHNFDAVAVAAIKAAAFGGDCVGFGAGASGEGHRVISSICRAIASAEMTYTRAAHRAQAEYSQAAHFFRPANDNRAPPAGWASLENVR